MENFSQAQKIISGAQNIHLLPCQNLRADSFPASLGFFYSLKDLGKNVNLIFKRVPKKFQFLTKELSTKTLTQQSLITIKEQKTKISQISYEKESGKLKLYLESFPNPIQEEDLSFEPLFSPDLLITIGIDKLKEVEKVFPKSNLQIINIDNQTGNENYGQTNLIEAKSSLSEIVFDFLNSIKEKIPQKAAASLLAGIVSATNNFRNQKTTSQTFARVKKLTETADYQEVITNILKEPSKSQLQLLGRILGKASFYKEKNTFFSFLEEKDFRETFSKESDLTFVLEKLKYEFFSKNFLLLWQERNSPLKIKGVFYCPDNSLREKFLRAFEGEEKGNGVLFLSQENDFSLLKEKFLNL
ncbi:hypothetical protein J7J81_01245 [bacterium]|nr:hypothetical protein [bacterium]